MVGVSIDGRVGEIANHHVFGEPPGERTCSVFVRRHGVVSLNRDGGSSIMFERGSSIPECLRKQKAQVLFIETFATTGLRCEPGDVFTHSRQRKQMNEKHCGRSPGIHLESPRPGGSPRTRWRREK